MLRPTVQLLATNPARGKVELRLELPHATRIRLRVFDLAGRLVRELPAVQRPSGQSRMTWDGLDQNRHPVASGLYFVRLELDDATLVRKVVLTR
jgi:flagellar hook assembly protein FlgD